MKNVEHPPVAAAANLSSDATWREIEDKLDLVSQLAASSDSAEEFETQLLTMTLRLLSGEGARIWVKDDRANLRTTRQLGSLAPPSNDDSVPVANVWSQVMPMAVDADAIRLLAPVTLLDIPVAVVEVQQAPDRSPASVDGYLELLAAICDAATAYYRRAEQARISTQLESYQLFQEFAAELQQTLRTTDTAYIAVNEGAALARCDRISLLTLTRGTWRVEAISGAPYCERRSGAVHLLTDLVRAVNSTSEQAVWFPDNGAEVDPYLRDAFDAYQEESSSRAIGVVPLKASELGDEGPARLIGAIVVEDFESDHFHPHAKDRVAALADQVAPALKRSLDFDAVPFARLCYPLRKWRGATSANNLLRLTMLAIALAAVAATLAFVRVPFYVEAKSELQPRNRQFVFAPENGVIEELSVTYGAQVDAGDLLIGLRDAELDRQWTELLGEIRTTQQAIAAVTMSRLNTAANARFTQADEFKRTADQAQLRQQLGNLEKERVILAERRKALQITSPLTGRVLSWNAKEKLGGRPVHRGQRLLTIADPEGPWLLEMHVPDEDIGYLLEADEDSQSQLPVKYYVATDPTTIHTTCVDSIGMSTVNVRPGEATVLVKAQVDGGSHPTKRAGASVVARIECGKRSVGFILFHRLWEAVRRQLWY